MYISIRNFFLLQTIYWVVFPLLDKIPDICKLKQRFQSMFVRYKVGISWLKDVVEKNCWSQGGWEAEHRGRAPTRAILPKSKLQAPSTNWTPLTAHKCPQLLPLWSNHLFRSPLMQGGWSLWLTSTQMVYRKHSCTLNFLEHRVYGKFSRSEVFKMWCKDAYRFLRQIQ